MGWLCLAARKLALQAGAGAAMIYRLIMFISGFLFPTRAVLSVPFKLWHIVTSFGASKLACHTWAGAAILPFQTEHLFRYLLFLLVRSPGTCQKSAWCSPFCLLCWDLVLRACLRLWLGLATQFGLWLICAPTKYTESNNYHVTLSDDSRLTWLFSTCNWFVINATWVAKLFQICVSFFQRILAASTNVIINISVYLLYIWYNWAALGINTIKI